MGKWKAQDRTVCIRGTVVCGQAEDDAECGIIVDAHNAAIDALTAERDRLAAENAIYKDRLNVLDRHCEDGIRIDVATLCSQLEDHRETLDRLREVVPEAVNSRPYDAEHLRGTIWHILYSKEATNDDR